MARVLIHVEGQTEESFVNNIIAPHLYDHGYDKAALVCSEMRGNVTIAVVSRPGV